MWGSHEMVDIDITHIYNGISFLLLGYPPPITSWVLHLSMKPGGFVGARFFNFFYKVIDDRMV
jgi:hypothetical protein